MTKFYGNQKRLILEKLEIIKAKICARTNEPEILSSLTAERLFDDSSIGLMLQFIVETSTGKKKWSKELMNYTALVCIDSLYMLNVNPESIPLFVFTPFGKYVSDALYWVVQGKSSHQRASVHLALQSALNDRYLDTMEIGFCFLDMKYMAVVQNGEITKVIPIAS